MVVFVGVTDGAILGESGADPLHGDPGEDVEVTGELKVLLGPLRTHQQHHHQIDHKVKGQD